jgi:glycerate-2-kinase
MSAGSRIKAEEIFRAALRAADPETAVRSRTDEIRSTYTSGGFERLLVLGAGKAAAAMASALEESLGDLITAGVLITKYGHLGGYSSSRIRAFEAAHPVPDENGLRATRAAMDMLETADGKTLLVCLISGGGSALLVSPYEGISLEEKQAITDLLLRAGADIFELNAVRKHLSRVKGGRLARAAFPATVVSLIISDVIGDRLDVIASGPTAPDASTYKDAIGVLEKYSVDAPDGVKRLFEKGIAGRTPETPKEGDEAFGNVKNIIVGSNRMALDAARDKAGQMGFRAEVISDSLAGEAKEAALRLAEKARSVKTRPACLISGGETTVTVKGTGKGGRNTELALAFAIEINGSKGITLLSAGTDGTDGPTDAAGAVADGTTVSRAALLRLDPNSHLRNNDSYNFFKREGGLIVTGPTGTNVMDIQIMLLE